MNISEHENLQAALLGVFDSQIAGGKRYDLATIDRCRANATYFESHGVDATTGLSHAMDMSLLMSETLLYLLRILSNVLSRISMIVFAG
jgi:hypothetical protein